MIKKTTIFKGYNLSQLWAEVFIEWHKNTINHLPIVIQLNVENNTIQEDNPIHDILCSEIIRNNDILPRSTADLIFPYSFWLRRGKPSIDDLSREYIQRLYPKIYARGKRTRGRTYFHRMINFSAPDDGSRGGGINQLKNIIGTFTDRRAKETSPRRSGLQASILDPSKDLVSTARSPFPCLQQVGFDYHGGTLSINAYYPTQFVFSRAYGNYLGLCHLGQFMAKEMGLNFDGLVCFIGSCQENPGLKKRDLKGFKDALESRVLELTTVPEEGDDA